MLNFRILWRAVKTTIFLFGLVGLIAWFAAAAPWYWRAGSALVVLAALALTYQIFAALHVRRVGVGRVGGSRDRSAVSRRRSAGQSVLKRREVAADCMSRRPNSDEDDELTPAQRRRLIAEIEARA